MLPKCRASQPTAFTLIELLVVVAIISLLISILLPSLSHARKKAKLITCAAQLHDIGAALMSYSAEYGRFPHQNTSGPDGTTRSQRTAVAMWGLSVHKEIANYMGGLRQDIDTQELSKTHEVFYCPFIDEEAMDFTDVVSGPGTGHGIQTSEDQYLHIGYTYFGRLDEVANDPALPRAPWEEDEEDVPDKRRHYAGKLPTSDDILMADTIMRWGGGLKWRINHGAGWQEPIDLTSMNTVPPIEGANELFADGHALWKDQEHFPELIKASGLAQIMLKATLDARPDSIWW